MAAPFLGMQEIAGRWRNKAKVSSVLLFTDGLANVGSSSADAILREMKKIRVSFCPRCQHVMIKSLKYYRMVKQGNLGTRVIWTMGYVMH